MPILCLIKVIPSNWTVGIISSDYLSRKSLMRTLYSGRSWLKLPLLSALMISWLFWVSSYAKATLLTWTMLAAFIWLLSITSALPSRRPNARPVCGSIERVLVLPEVQMTWELPSEALPSWFEFASGLSTLKLISPPTWRYTGDRGWTTPETRTLMTSKTWGCS